MTPTAVANVVMQFPLIKHAVGVFGTCDASPKTLKRTLKDRSVVLYPGGIAELFLCDDKEERIFVKKRKGFVKVALQTGVDIIPVYLFGNTQVLKVAKSAALRAFARATGVTVTWFWGVWGTVVPFEKKIVSAMGRPLGIPHIPEPTQEDIEKYHTLYVNEVQRIFDTYKVTNPDFVNKQLIFSE
uniref:diacylglycerol O-acyltransferase n=1 Tax=Pyramimonas obovata TaxID=1411642 RepID=A0A7S0WRW5_9CHLO